MLIAIQKSFAESWMRWNDFLFRSCFLLSGDACCRTTGDIRLETKCLVFHNAPCKPVQGAVSVSFGRLPFLKQSNLDLLLHAEKPTLDKNTLIVFVGQQSGVFFFWLSAWGLPTMVLKSNLDGCILENTCLQDILAHDSNLALSL